MIRFLKPRELPALVIYYYHHHHRPLLLHCLHFYQLLFLY